MGFQDRGYYRSRPSGGVAEWSAVNTIIALSVAVWLANFILAGNLLREIISIPLSVNDFFSLKWNLFQKPWQAWQLLTYGFLHNGSDPWHILGNMITLWFFGRPVEAVTGKAEFIRFYCTAIILAGLAWVVSTQISGVDLNRPPVLVGASGGVTAVLAVFIWYYPRETVYFFGVLPMPAWVLGLIFLVLDIQGTRNQSSEVAHVAHIAGAAFGLVYAWRRMDLSSLTEWPARLLGKVRAPRLRIMRPDDDALDDSDVPLESEVDRILEKISRSGESSLTSKERDTLTRASRRLKNRRG